MQNKKRIKSHLNQIIFLNLNRNFFNSINQKCVTKMFSNYSKLNNLKNLNNLNNSNRYFSSNVFNSINNNFTFDSLIHNVHSSIHFNSSKLHYNLKLNHSNQQLNIQISNIYFRNFHTDSSKRSPQTQNPNNSNEHDENQAFFDTFFNKKDVSFFERFFQYRVKIFTLDNIQIISNFEKWKVLFESFVKSLILILFLYYVLKNIERFRKQYHITTEKIQDDAQYLIYGLIALNVLLYLLSFHPRFMVSQYKWLAFVPGEVGVIPKIGSAFLHSGIFHLTFNMVALKSFGIAAACMLGPEHFLFMYFASEIICKFFVEMLEIHLLKRQRVHIGASGAILFVVAFMSIIVPNSLVHIIFLPNFEFTIKNAVLSLLVIDTIGLLLSRTRFSLPIGHAAHIGGSLTGLFYGANYKNTPWKPEGIFPGLLYKDLKRDRL